MPWTPYYYHFNSNNLSLFFHYACRNEEDLGLNELNSTVSWPISSVVFEEDKLWGVLRPIPGVMLWISIFLCFILPSYAPWMVAVITFGCMGQCIVTMLFSLAYCYSGFRKMERSMMYPVTIPPLSSTKSLDLLHLDDGKIQQPLNVGSMGGMEGSKPAGAHEKEVGGVGMGLETRYASGGIMSTLPNVSLSAFSSIAVASMSTAASQPLSSPIAGVSNGGHSGGDTTILRISAGGITEAGSDDSHGNSVSAQSGAQPRGMAGSVVNLSSSIAKGEGGSSSSLNLPNQVHPAEVVHLVAIARCTEPIDVVEDVLDSLAQHSNRGQYIICLCLESRDPHATRFGEELTVRYGLTFKRVLFYIHPSGIEKEVPGKSSNINFGVRGAHATLEKERGGGLLCPVTLQLRLSLVRWIM